MKCSSCNKSSWDVRPSRLFKSVVCNECHMSRLKLKDPDLHSVIIEQRRQHIKQSRQTLNLTQVQLAPLLGVSVKSIKNYEQGIREPSKSVLILLEQLVKAESKRGGQ
jgi:DNA-binding transcriptional regulator YiaG